VSPSTYIIALPLGVIAVSTWLVKMENDTFLKSGRTTEIQEQARNQENGGVKVPIATPVEQFSHDRYGWKDNSQDLKTALGNDRPRRTIGSRPGQNADWLELQVEAKNASTGELPSIPGYIETEAMGESPFSTVPADSGFHITADEATKLDVKTQRVTFNGHVKLNSPQFDLTAKTVVVLLSKDKKTFKVAEATGDVNVQLKTGPPEKRYRGQSSKAVYEPSAGMITMTGWPKIQGQGQEIIAAAPETKVMLYTASGKLLTEGRTQTRVAKQLIAEDSAKRDAASQSGE